MTTNPLIPVGDDFPEPHMEEPEASFDEELSGVEKGMVTSAILFGLCLFVALLVLTVKRCSA